MPLWLNHYKNEQKITYSLLADTVTELLKQASVFILLYLASSLLDKAGSVARSSFNTFGWLKIVIFKD